MGSVFFYAPGLASKEISLTAVMNSEMMARGAEAGQTEWTSTVTVSSSVAGRNQIGLLARLSDPGPEQWAQVCLPPSRPYTSPSLGTRQVEMGSSRWPETLEKRRGSGVS